MGRLRRLVEFVILTFLLKSVNGQAIFDEQTEIEERFLNVATRVMDTLMCFLLCSGPQVYMVLSGGCVYYFKNEYSSRPAGKFTLYGYSS